MKKSLIKNRKSIVTVLLFHTFVSSFRWSSKKVMSVRSCAPWCTLFRGVDWWGTSFHCCPPSNPIIASDDSLKHPPSSTLVNITLSPMLADLKTGLLGPNKSSLLIRGGGAIGSGCWGLFVIRWRWRRDSGACLIGGTIGCFFKLKASVSFWYLGISTSFIGSLKKKISYNK